MNRNLARPIARPHARSGRKTPVLLAMVLGLGGGLLLSGPLADWLSQGGRSVHSGIPNPFAAWADLGSQDLLLLGTDVGGGNTEVGRA